jgi:hypothetical protein
MPTIWPHDDTASKVVFFGDPRKAGFESNWLVNIVPPYQMYYDGHALKTIRVNKKIASVLLLVFGEILDKCGHDQKKVDAIGASVFGGCYNFRPIRGASSLSNHAFGAAIDINSNNLPLGSKTAKMNPIIYNAFKNQGALMGQDYIGRKDPMHAEFVSR